MGVVGAIASIIGAVGGTGGDSQLVGTRRSLEEEVAYRLSGLHTLLLNAKKQAALFEASVDDDDWSMFSALQALRKDTEDASYVLNSLLQDPSNPNPLGTPEELWNIHEEFRDQGLFGMVSLHARLGTPDGEAPETLDDGIEELREWFRRFTEAEARLSQTVTHTLAFASLPSRPGERENVVQLGRNLVSALDMILERYDEISSHYLLAPFVSDRE